MNLKQERLITREELINNPENWHTTEKLNLDFFDYACKNISNSYYLKQKGKEQIYYGKYDPKSKSFICYKLKDPNQIIIKRENISDFFSLPSINFEVSYE